MIPGAAGGGQGAPREDAGGEHVFDGFRGRDDSEVWETLVRWRAEGRRFALLTVIETRGFTPRKAGAHMLLDEGGATWGTVGGGAIEHEALAAARELLAAGGASRTVRHHLTQDLGMCCGGEMAVHVEAVETAPRLYVFGAGYLARALAPLAAGCGFRVTVVDERPEWADAARFARATVVCRAPEEFARETRFEPRDYAVIVTHDHGLDQRVVEALLPRPLAFLGMIGSVPKQRKFAMRLAARGFAEADIARLRSPLGVAIGAATPEEIAVSVMAEIIAARRGVPLGPAWTPPARHGEETALAARRGPAGPEGAAGAPVPGGAVGSS